MRSHRNRLFVLPFLLLVLIVGLMNVSAQTAPTPALTVVYGATQSEPVSPSESGAARDLPDAPTRDPRATPVIIPRQVYPREGNGERGTDFFPFDPLAGTFSTSSSLLQRAFSAPKLNFPGQDYTNRHPSDNVGDVGPAHYLQMVNGPAGAEFAVYDKTNGTVVRPPAQLNLLATANTPCRVAAKGDPIVLYDQYVDRWLMAEFAEVVTGNTSTFYLCVYISATDNPLDSWRSYPFTVPEFPDYPKIGVWHNAYYVSTNESLPALYALDRTKMLAGETATYLRVTAPPLSGFGFQALTPADADGDTLPSAGAPGIFMRHADDEAHDLPNIPTNPTGDFVQIFFYNPNFAVPANSSLAGPLNINISEFDSNLCGLGIEPCFPQPNTAIKLDPVSQVIMWRLQYRNFGSYQAMVGNFVTDVDQTNRGGVRWFEVRGTGQSWSLHQEGTVAGADNISRWIGAISMDKYGNIALGYNITGPNTFPSIRYTGRLYDDPLGQMTQGENTIQNGLASNQVDRWGDYNSMNVDPVDDCTFWFTGNYVPAGGNWDTRISALRFDVCDNGAPSPTPIITPTQPILTEEVITNGGFELAVDNAPSFVPWVLRFPSRDKLKCNKDKTGDGIPDRIFAKSGNCAFMFRGVPGERTKLQQSFRGELEVFVVGDRFDLTGFVNANSAVLNARIKLRIKYSDGTPTSKSTRTLTPAEGYQPFTLTLGVQSENVVQVKVQIDHRSPSGKMFVDDVSMIWTLIPDTARSTRNEQKELIPLP